MKNRVLWKMLVLSIVTLGIYRLYWFIKTRREIMNLRPEVKILSPAFLIIPVVLVVTAIVISIIVLVSSNLKNCSFSSSGSTYSGTQVANQLNNSNCGDSASSAVGFLILYGGIFIAYIFFVVWEWSYSHGVEAVTGGKLNFAMSLVVLILVPDGIDILIIQDSFNKLGQVGAGPAGQAYAPAPTPPPYNPPQVQPPAPPAHDHNSHHHQQHPPTGPVA